MLTLFTSIQLLQWNLAFRKGRKLQKAILLICDNNCERQQIPWCIITYSSIRVASSHPAWKASGNETLVSFAVWKYICSRERATFEELMNDYWCFALLFLLRLLYIYTSPEIRLKVHRTTINTILWLLCMASLPRTETWCAHTWLWLVVSHRDGCLLY